MLSDNSDVEAVVLPSHLYRFLLLHADAVNMLVVGYSDYVASRACRKANSVFQAAILGEQAVEKALKAGVRLAGDMTPFRKLGHDLPRIAAVLQDAQDWFDLRGCADLLNTLDHHFKFSRYPRTSEDNVRFNCRLGLADTQFDELDHLILDFYDAVPMPEEIRFSLGVYGTLHNRRQLSQLGLPCFEWDAIAWNNRQLARGLGSYEAKADEYFETLARLPLPGLMKAHTELP